MNRNELIEFIVDAVQELEGISSADRLHLVEKLNKMSNEELGKEADWYSDLLDK